MNLQKEYDDRIIFEKLNLEISDHERIGIVGNNGAGKTTLMNILMGYEEPSQGRVIMSPDTVISMMPQVHYEEENDFLSGGERTKKALLKSLKEYSNVLILDEPTNHLDYKGIKWLKGLIDGYYGTVIIVSHDRYFLDLVCDVIVELDNKKCTRFKGNYSDYQKEKQHRYQSQVNQYEKQKEMKETIQEDIRQLKGWSDKAHRESRQKGLATGNKIGSKEYFRAKAKKKDKAIKSKIKRLEKIDVEGVKKPEDQLEIKFRFQGAHQKISQLCLVEDLVMGFGERVLFTSNHFWINKGERIGFLGLNGTGKSTFIRGLQGDIEPLDGKIYFNPNISVGYLSQEVIDLDEDKTVLDSLNIVRKDKLTIARIQLNNLGITKDMVHKKIKTLSMGERTRVKLAKIILEQNDILILDEPTNHLDIITRETLENALAKYEGTLLIVSHDYYMLEKLCKSTLLIEEKKLKKIDQSPKDWFR